MLDCGVNYSTSSAGIQYSATEQSDIVKLYDCFSLKFLEIVYGCHYGQLLVDL